MTGSRHRQVASSRTRARRAGRLAGAALLLAPFSGRAAIPVVQEWYQFRQARAAFQDGLYDVAEARLERFLELHSGSPREPEAWLMLGQARFLDNRAGEAVAALTEGLARDPEGGMEPALRFWLGRALAQDGQTERALAELARVWTERPQAPEAAAARIQAALVWQRLERWQETIATVDALLAAAGPGDRRLVESGLLARARARFALGAFDEAEADLRRLMADGAENRDEAALWLGRVLAARGRGEAALAIWRPVAEGSPSAVMAVDAWLELAAIRADGRAGPAGDDVAESLRQAVARAVGDPSLHRSALVRAAEIASRCGREADVIPWIADWLQANPADLLRDQVRLRLADLYASSGQLERATHAYREVSLVESAPLRAAALVGLGSVLGRQAQYADAIAAFRLALDGMPESDAARADALLQLGQACLANSDPAEAATVFRRFLEEARGDPRGAQVLFHLGTAEERQGQSHAAIDTYLRVPAWPGVDPELAARAAYQAAGLQLKVGRLADAGQAFARVVALAPAGALAVEAQLGAAQAFAMAGDWTRARVLLETVLAKPELPERLRQRAAYDRAWYIESQGDADAARAAFTAFVAEHPLSPDAPEALFWLGQDAFDRRDLALAEERFRALALSYPESERAQEAWYWAGRSAARDARWLDASAAYQQLIDRHPRSSWCADARFGQGEALTQLGQFESAIIAYETMIDEWPQSPLVPEAWGRKGDCCWTLRQYQRALNCYREVERLEPREDHVLSQAIYKQGQALEAMGQSKEALLKYTRVVYDYFLGMGVAEGAPAGGVRPAGAEALRLVRDPFWFTKCAFAAGELLEREGQAREAARIYQRVVEADVPAAAEARRRVERLLGAGGGALVARGAGERGDQ